jgi:hypothetical protein
LKKTIIIAIILASLQANQAKACETTICHHGITKTVDSYDVPRHLSHGDTLGECPDTCVEECVKACRCEEDYRSEEEEECDDDHLFRDESDDSDCEERCVEECDTTTSTTTSTTTTTTVTSTTTSTTSTTLPCEDIEIEEDPAQAKWREGNEGKFKIHGRLRPTVCQPGEIDGVGIGIYETVSGNLFLAVGIPVEQKSSNRWAGKNDNVKASVKLRQINGYNYYAFKLSAKNLTFQPITTLKLTTVAYVINQNGVLDGTWEGEIGKKIQIKF